MNYNNIAPSGTFIHQYMEYMQQQETATVYDFWCALWMLSCACGRDIFVDRPRAPVYLNLYTILVAESGITRKSSAIRKAVEIVSIFNKKHEAFLILENKTTPEQLDAILHERTRETGSAKVAIAVSELATFLGVERYTKTMPPLLTDLYDCPATRNSGGTISRGRVEQASIWVSFLSASTPSWLYRAVNPSITQGGFTSRCIFVSGQKPKKHIPWPENNSNTQEYRGHTTAEHTLADFLSRVCYDANRYCRISISSGGLTTFTNWYNKRQMHLDDFRSSFESREDAHVLRCAALLCVNDDTWVIQKSHITHAIKIIAECKEEAGKLFEGNNEKTKWIQGVVSVRDKLLAYGSEAVPRTQLYLCCRKFLDNHEFAALLDVLHESGAVQKFTRPALGRGRPSELYRATTLLSTKGIVAKLEKDMMNSY